MSIINEYRFGDENLEQLQVPDINVAQPQPIAQAQTPSLPTVNPDGTVGSMPQEQDYTQPVDSTVDYSTVEQLTQQNISNQTQQFADQNALKNQVEASAVTPELSENPFQSAFVGEYDYNQTNAMYDELIKNAKEMKPSVALTPGLDTVLAESQEKSEPSWLERGLQAINYGGNALQGAMYEVPNTFLKVDEGLRNLSGGLAAATGGTFEQGASSFDQFRKVMPSIGNVWGFVNSKVQDYAKPFRANDKFDAQDLIPNIDFDKNRNYLGEALGNKDMSITGTESGQVGQTGFAPVGVVQSKLDKDNAWKNPTRYAGYVYDFATGFATGAGLQKGVTSTVGKVVGAATKSTVAAQRAAKAADIVIDPAGEALGAVLGAGFRKVKSLVRPSGSKAVENIIPTTSVSVSNVPPKAAASLSKGAQVNTLQGSGKVTNVDFEKGVLTYKTATGSTVTANISDLTDGASDVVVAKPPKGGAALPMVTPTKRASIPLAEGVKRQTTSVRDVGENVKQLTYSFATTQPSITPYRLATVPPSVVATETPGVVTPVQSRYNFLQQQQAIGNKVDAQELAELENAVTLPADIPEVDARVFTGAMSYGDLSEVVSQQVPGTQVDVGALFQAPRSTEDLHILAARMGFPFSDVPVSNAELLEFVYKQAPDNVNIQSIFSEYGVPVPTQTLKEATDIRVKVQEGVPFKQPQADVVVRQNPSQGLSETFESFFAKQPDTFAQVLKKLPVEQRLENMSTIARYMQSTKEVQDLGSLTQGMRRNLEQLNTNLDLSTARTLETPDIGRKYDPDFTSAPEETPQASFKKAKPTYENLMHGSRVQNIEMKDAVAAGKRAELGTGFYVTTNPELAKSYALADVSPNLPSAGRVYGEPRVTSFALDSQARVLDVMEPATDDIKEAFAEVLDKPQLTKAQTVDDLYNAVDKNIVKYGYTESLATEAYRSINSKLRQSGVKAVQKGDTLNVLDMGALKTNYSQPIQASDDVLEAVAHRYNVDSQRAALNPKNIQAQVDFEESSVRLQAEMKGKLEADLEDAELKQRNAVTKLLSEQDDIETAKLQQMEQVETSRAEARLKKSERELDKLFDENINPDPCQP